MDHVSRGKKKFATAVIYYSGAAIGVTDTFFGPSLIEFKNALDTDIETINVVSTTCQIFLLASIFCFSLIFNHVRRETLAPLLLSLLGTAIVLLPCCGNLWSFGFVISLMSITRGGVIAAQIVWIIDIWHEASGPFLQAQHFFHAVGVIFPPLVFAPYLSNGKGPSIALPLPHLGGNGTTLSPEVISTAHPVIINGDFGGDSSWNGTVLPRKRTVDLYTPSAICGGIIFFGAILQLILYVITREPRRKEDLLQSLTVCDENSGGSLSPVSESNTESVVDEAPPGLAGKEEIPGEKAEEEDKRETGEKVPKIVLILVSIIMYGSFLSAELITVDFITVFLHYSSLEISTEEGAHILIVSALAYIISTFVGILLNLKISSRYLIRGNICLLLLGFTLLWISTSTVNDGLMRVAVIVMGIGLSTGIPSIFHYIELHLHITNLIGAALTVSSALQVLGYRFIVGGLIEHSPNVYLYVFVGILTGIISGLVLFSILTRK